ncbi:HAD family phosphatase [Solwaraspora sp. WMMD937]|uniref:HAD family hydrolase n=1 Tax=Solwaraspora sp. WMMD937 TaxID=3016090 RepID=UPI00249AA195|nr:HAD family phosphatase [Solwaraspora sp. WMMD937]WFE19585.1 HAD family phosphatase [Solwaraspora sp. WMMD937]
MISAVVFDMDGVLIDTEPVWEQVRRDYVAGAGGRWLPDAQQRLMGMSTPEWAGYLDADLGVGRGADRVADEVIDAMAARYRAELPLIPGAIEVVRDLAGRFPLALASSSPRRLIEQVLATAGLTEAFRATVSTEECAAGKPDPEVYQVAARLLGVPPGRCLAVEDSSNGLRSAVAAGLVAVAVPHPAYPPAADALAGATLVVDRLDELTVDRVLALDDEVR